MPLMISISVVEMSFLLIVTCANTRTTREAKNLRDFEEDFPQIFLIFHSEWENLKKSKIEMELTHLQTTFSYNVMIVSLNWDKRRRILILFVLSIICEVYKWLGKWKMKNQSFTIRYLPRFILSSRKRRCWIEKMKFMRRFSELEDSSLKGSHIWKMKIRRRLEKLVKSLCHGKKPRGEKW